MERLIEVTTEVTENAEELEYRLMELAKKHQELMLRVQRVVFRVESQSPVVSEAENCMMDELEGLNNHLERRMNRRLTEVCVCVCVFCYMYINFYLSSIVPIQARRKLELCKDASLSPSVSLSEQQSVTILKTLAERCVCVCVLRTINCGAPFMYPPNFIAFQWRVH